jgi:hypothetical protein
MGWKSEKKFPGTKTGDLATTAKEMTVAETTETADLRVGCRFPDLSFARKNADCVNPK